MNMAGSRVIRSPHYIQPSIAGFINCQKPKVGHVDNEAGSVSPHRPHFPFIYFSCEYFAQLEYWIYGIGLNMDTASALSLEDLLWKKR